METVSLYVLGLIAVGIVSYFAGCWKYRDKLDVTQACLSGERHAHHEWCSRYAKLYELYLSIPHTYENSAEEMYLMLKGGMPRKDIAERFNVPYPTVCGWLRKKEKEMENIEININPVQNPLIQ